MTRESYLAQFYGKSQNYTDIPVSYTHLTLPTT